jgi:hypothetical protein
MTVLANAIRNLPGYPNRLTLKMATTMFAETFNNLEYSIWRVSES